MTEEELEDLIAEWHNMPWEQYCILGWPTLDEYLGWSPVEYDHWAETGEMPNGD